MRWASKPSASAAIDAHEIFDAGAFSVIIAIIAIQKAVTRCFTTREQFDDYCGDIVGMRRREE